MGLSNRGERLALKAVLENTYIVRFLVGTLVFQPE